MKLARNVIVVDFKAPVAKGDKLPACFFQPQVATMQERYHADGVFRRELCCYFKGPRPCFVAFGVN